MLTISVFTLKIHKSSSFFNLDQSITLALQFNSHKSVQKLFHNLHIILSNSLMGFKVTCICQLEKETLKGLANVQKTFS